MSDRYNPYNREEDNYKRPPNPYEENGILEKYIFIKNSIK